MDVKAKNKKSLFLVFVFIFLLVFIAGNNQLYTANQTNFFQQASYNFFTRLNYEHNKSSDNVVLVVIDDDSLAEIGRWPWKREYYLEIFDYLENYTNTKLIGYDGLIMIPDREYTESDKKFFSQIKNYKKITAGVSFSYNNFSERIDVREYEKLLKLKTDIKIIDKRKDKHNSAHYKSFTALQPEYFKNINSLGSVDVMEDKDGFVRRAIPLVNYKGDFYPSLSLKLYSRYSGIDEFTLTDKYLEGSSDKFSLRIPINSYGGFVTNYIYYYGFLDSIEGIYSHKRYSASDIINSYRAIKKGKKPIIDPAEFDGKVVFFGAYAQAQALSDAKRTPISPQFAGVDIQATNFDNLVRNDFLKSTNIFYDFLMCLLIFALVLWCINTLPVFFALLSSIFIGFLYFFFSYCAFINKVMVNWLLPEIFILFALIFAYSYKYLIEDTKKTKMQKAMGKYLSYDVMQNVVENIDNIALGGKRADITVLFADIRNFTSISENMDAASTSMILNEYFSALVPIIEKHNGVLNKFMGDAVLAIFGEPKKSENHALDAVRCGYQMLKKVKYLQEKWIDEGKPKIEIGIGISSGEAFVGNIGSAERLEYTVIGDTVNTASRIENYNKVYKTNFLISEETYNRTKKYIDTITIKDVVIRGKANKVNLYEVIRLID